MTLKHPASCVSTLTAARRDQHHGFFVTSFDTCAMSFNVSPQLNGNYSCNTFATRFVEHHILLKSTIVRDLCTVLTDNHKSALLSSVDSNILAILTTYRVGQKKSSVCAAREIDIKVLFCILIKDFKESPPFSHTVRGLHGQVDGKLKVSILLVEI